MKRLILVRHAKSSWKDVSLSDRERPLNKRGLQNAPEMAVRLKEKIDCIDLICSSPAKRAFTTASFFVETFQYPASAINIDESLYFQGWQYMFELIKTTNSEINTLMLVGHNPDMTNLFNFVCGFQTDNMPTSATALISIPGSWISVEPGNGQLQDYDYPKKH